MKDKNHNIIKTLNYTSLLFMFVYAVPIYGVFNSSYLATIVSFFIIVTNKNRTQLAYKTLKNPLTIILAASYIFIIIYTIAISYFSGSHDLYILKTWVNNILSLIGAILIISLYFSYFYPEQKFEKFLFYILLVQSIYIVFAILFPTISENVQALIRTDVQIERMIGYQGIRGVALSGSMAFGLAITMSLLGFFSTIWLINDSKMHFLLKFILFTICLLASLSAGRTAIIGFVFGILYVAPSLLNAKVIIKAMIIALIMTLLMLYLYNDNIAIKTLVDKYSAYTFEPIALFINTGSFKVSSLKSLESMYFLPPIDTLIIGDTKYIDDSNPELYYKGTDSGYMRFILYYGIIGSLIPYLSFIFISLYIGINSKNKKILKIITLIIVMSFVLQYKGEVILFAIGYMKIFFCVGLYFHKKKEYYYEQDSYINTNI